MKYLAVVIGAAFYFLGFVGFGLWPLAFFSLIPLWWALEQSLGDHYRKTFAVGWLYGTVTYIGGYHWLVSMLEVFSSYGLIPSILVMVIFCTYLGLNFAFYATLYRFARNRGWSIIASAIPALIVTETFFPHLFPSYLSNSLYRQTTFVQIVELGGPTLLSAIIALVSVLIFELYRWQTGQRERPTSIIVFAVTMIAATLIYGAIRIPQIEARVAAAPKINIGVVQVNMGIFEKRRDAAEGLRRHVEQTKRLYDNHNLDLVIWPESAYIRRLPRELPIDGRRVTSDVRSPILFGGVTVEYPEGGRRIYNTAFMLDRDRKIRSTYDKTYLLMFGEYLPFSRAFPWLHKLSPNSGKFTAGSHVKPLYFDDWVISVPICYEDVLPSFTRKMVRASDPHLLVNITNDAWFGETQEPWIHLALSQFRAIEHRRYLVRSTNSGVSAIVDPVGRLVSRTDAHVRDDLVGEVAMMRPHTVYGLLGNWPGWVSALFVAFMLVGRKDRRHGARGSYE